MRKTNFLWILPLLLAVVFLGCPTGGGDGGGTGDPGPGTDTDTRIELAAGEDRNVSASATSATVTFTGSGLTAGSMPNDNFIVTTGGEITSVNVAGNIVTVTVGFTANSGAERTFTVSINTASTLIKGTATRVITQAAFVPGVIALTPGAGITPAFNETPVSVVFTSAADALSGVSLAASDFVITPAGQGATITGDPVVSGGNTVTLSVALEPNNSGAVKHFTVNVSPSNTKISAATGFSIDQGFEGDTRVGLIAGENVNVGCDAVTAIVTFTGAGALTKQELENEFEYSTGLTPTVFDVNNGTVTITVSFAKNTDLLAPKVYKVSIKDASTVIWGGSVDIIQAIFVPVLTPGAGITPAYNETPVSVVFTSADGPITGILLDASDFEITPAGQGATIVGDPVISDGNKVTLSVALTPNTSGAVKNFTVNVSPSSTKISATTGFSIEQNFDPRVELAAGNNDNVAASATSASVTFTGSGLTPGSMLNGNFSVTTGGEITSVNVAGDTVTVTVGFTANSGAERTFTVSINPASTVIKGTAERVITQAALPKIALTPGAGITPAFNESPVSVVFTSAADALTDVSLAASDFVIDPAGQGATITGTPVVTLGNTVTLSVALTPNTSDVVKHFTVNVSPSSTKISAATGFSIEQGFEGDTRVLLTAGENVNVGHTDVTAIVTFTGAGALTKLELENEFEYSTGLTPVDIEVDDGTVTINVSFAKNTNTLAPKVYNVSIKNNSTVIWGGSVDIIQAPRTHYFLPAFRMVDFEFIDLGAFNGGGLWTYRGNTIGTTGAMTQRVATNDLANGNASSRVFEVSANNQGSNRGLQIDFAKTTADVDSEYTKHKIAFDWRPSIAGDRPSEGNYGYLGIQDGKSAVFGNPSAGNKLDNQFIAFYMRNVGNNEDPAMFYRVGNVPVTDHTVPATGTNSDVFIASALTSLVPITGITREDFNRWYRFEVIIDTETKTIDFTITGLWTGSTFVYTQTNLPFDPAVTYNPQIASIRFAAQRNTNNVTWFTFIDNIVLSRDAEIPANGEINVNVFFNTNQTIDISGWNNRLSKSVNGGIVEVTIENLATADWYLNDAIIPFSGKTYNLDLNNLRLGQNFLTLVVKRNGMEYSRKLAFTVVN